MNIRVRYVVITPWLDHTFGKWIGLFLVADPLIEGCLLLV